MPGGRDTAGARCGKRARRATALAAACGVMVALAAGGVAAATGPSGGAGQGQPVSVGSEGGDCHPPAAVALPALAPGVSGGFNVSEEVLKALAKAALGKAADSAIGWVSTLIFGPSDTDQIKAQIAEVSRQLQQVNEKVTQLQKDLEEAAKRIIDDAHRNTYNTLVGQLQDHQLNEIAALERKFDSFVLSRPPNSPLDADATDTLDKIREKMPEVIDGIDLQMVGSGGLLAYFDDLAWQHQPFYRHGVTADRAIYTASYLGPAYTQIDEYMGWLVRALSLLSEAYHISYKDSSGTHPANSQFVSCEVQVVEESLAKWRLQAAQGIEPIPANTAVDAGTGLMWSRSALTLSGQPKIDGLPAYCWTNDEKFVPAPKNLKQNGCVYIESDIFASLAPSPPLPLPTAPLPSIVRGLTYGNLTGWRIPTPEDIDSLVPSGTADAFSWLEAQGFKADPTSSLKRGSLRGDEPYPMLSDTGDDGGTTVISQKNITVQNGCVSRPLIGQLCREVPGLLYVVQQYFVGSR